MARPQRQGLDYYSLDTDVFSNRKIRRLIKNFGGNGYMVYSYLLTEIYRDKGCFIEWDENTAFDVSDVLNLKESLVKEVVNYCCSVGLFNKELRTSEKILTTKKIQEFWLKVTKKAGRKVTTIDSKFNLISGVIPNISGESTPNGVETPTNDQESTQRKGKETKVNKEKESKKKSRISTPPNFLEFKNYGLENFKEVDLEKLELKYKSWVANGWKDGHDKPIKNWKSKLLNTLPFLKKEELKIKNSENKMGFAVNR